MMTKPWYWEFDPFLFRLGMGIFLTVCGIGALLAAGLELVMAVIRLITGNRREMH